NTKNWSPDKRQEEKLQEPAAKSTETSQRAQPSTSQLPTETSTETNTGTCSAEKDTSEEMLSSTESTLPQLE
ncbi:hypothetical protein ABMA28_009552, partial [Loxostege sticticalis]